jgi:hypothetical protein
MTRAMLRHSALALVFGAGACSPKNDTPATDTTATTQASAAAPATTTTDMALTNAMTFHVLDYVAWNNHDLDVFRRIHAPDVQVVIGGAPRTEGIDAHIQALQPIWVPSALITNHAPIVAEGEWTCMVGTFAPPAGGKMVTVAKWRDGAISEEYILSNLLKPGAAKPTVSGPPVASISNRNAEMKRQVGAELGWSCALERTADGKMVISLSKSGGTAAEQMVFTQ